MFGRTRKALLAAVCAVGTGACSEAGSGDARGAAARTTGPATVTQTAVSASPSAVPQEEERWTMVSADAAPLLMSLTEKTPPPMLATRGELVRVGKEAGTAKWNEPLEGIPLSREGPVFRVRHTSEGSEVFAFQSDLGGEVSVSSSRALCASLAKVAPFELSACGSNLQRAVTADGAIVSYLSCGTGACPIALSRDGNMTAVSLLNVARTFFISGKKKSFLLAVSRTTEAEGKLTAGSLVVFALEGPQPSRLVEYMVDSVDARDPNRVIQRNVSLSVNREQIAIVGSMDVRAPDGQMLSSQKVDERHALPALD